MIFGVGIWDGEARRCVCVSAIQPATVRVDRERRSRGVCSVMHFETLEFVVIE